MSCHSKDIHWVTLSETVDGTPKTYTPSGVWCSIEPSAPNAFGENKISHIVGMRYHPQMTMNTILTTERGDQLFVRGIQDVEYRQFRHVLLCEQVMTP